MYDSAGRMTAADYRDYSQAGSWSWNNMHRDYSVSGIDYDANGNMLHMTQRGKGVNGTPVTIDSLFYEYDNGNKLLSVTDLGLESTPTIHDFDNSQASPSTYTYDGSGNLASDALKDLSLFYNHLNLPTEINKGTSGEITKIYTASGTLVQKSVTESGNVNIEQYWGPFVYKDDVLL